MAAACCVVPGVLSPESESQSFGMIDRPKSLSPVPCGLLLSREVGPGTGFPWVWMVVWRSLDSSATSVEILTIEWWKHVATKHHAMDRTTSTGRKSIRGLEGFLAWRGSSTIIEVRLRSRQTSKQEFGEEIGGRSAPAAAAAAAVLPVMTNNDSNHQKWDGLIHPLVLGKFHSIAPTNTAGYLALPRVVKPINYCLPELPDPGVDIRRIPSARFCSRISVLAPPGHHTRPPLDMRVRCRSGRRERYALRTMRPPSSIPTCRPTMTAVVSTLFSIQCLLTSLYKTTMPVGLDGLPLSMCERCATATGETVVLVRRRSPCPSALESTAMIDG